MGRWLAQVFDVREGERALTRTACLVLLLIYAGHTVVETARDTLFLSRLPPSQLNVVYLALALLSFLVGSAGALLTRVLGRRGGLVASLAFAGCATAVLPAWTQAHAFPMFLYLYSGVVGALLLSQFWVLLGQTFTLSQGRRLFGLVVAGGLLGGVLGASTAALVLSRASVSALLHVAAALWLAAALVVKTVHLEDVVPPAEGGVAEPPPGAARTFAEYPLLGRVAAIAALSTAFALVVDYLFKSTAAHVLSPSALGPFFARLYTATYAISLVVQLLVATRVLHRLGVIGALAVTPLLLTLGGLGPLLTGAFAATVGIKLIDGGLRHSLNRVATELLYLPLPGVARARGKPFIDNVVTRLVQAGTAATLYALAVRDLASTQVLGTLAFVLSAAWLAGVLASRGKYLDLLHVAVASGRLRPFAESKDLDLASAETLVEGLASRDPKTVVAAMDILSQKGRSKLIPALVLYHESPRVLERALVILAEGQRRDWVPLAERLMDSPVEEVRCAALHALARRGVSAAIDRALDDPSSRVQAYAAVHRVLRSERDPMQDPLIATLLQIPGAYGAAARLELLAAIADAPTQRLSGVLLVLARSDVLGDGRGTANLVRAMTQIRDPRFVSVLIEQLQGRAPREKVRDALLQLGTPAFDALVLALRADATPRRVRLHVPRAIACFQSQAACDVLTEQLAAEQDGLVRFKVLRGLGALVPARVRFDRRRLLPGLREQLDEHLRLIGIRVALAGPRSRGLAAASSEYGALLVGLLDAKIDQALERAFRILKLLHPREDLHEVFDVVRGHDRRARARAVEYIDALLARRSLRLPRALFRLALDELSDPERALRATPLVGSPPGDARQAIDVLTRSRDPVLAELAAAVAGEQHAGP